MGRALNYQEARRYLERTFVEAEEHFREDRVVHVPKVVESAADILFRSNTQAFREALLGCVLARILDDEIDVRKPYTTQGDDAFNGRTLDERVINPFLHEKEIPCSKGPYLAAFRRNISFIPETGRGLRDKEAYAAMLAFLEQLEAADEDEAKSYLRFLLISFIGLRERSNIVLSRINRLSVEQYGLLLEAMLRTPSGGLLPVLLAVATFKAMKDFYGLPWDIQWQGINVADAARGAGGDITIFRDGRIVIAVEVTERVIDADRIRSTFRTKISPNALDDYLFFYAGTDPTEQARASARAYFAQGHEINFAPHQTLDDGSVDCAWSKGARRLHREHH
jgi:hypothetical protein